MKAKNAPQKPITKNSESVVWKTLVYVLVLVGFALFLWEAFTNKNMLNTVVTGQRPELYKPTTAFRLVKKIPAEEKPTSEYEIRLKFSENITPEDFEVRTTNIEMPLRKIVVESKPDTLWILPERRWEYNTPYKIIVSSVNPDKKLNADISFTYEFKEWGGPPPEYVDQELRESTATVKEK